MSAATAVRKADALALAAADKLAQAMRDLERAARILEETPECASTLRAQKAGKSLPSCATYPGFRYASLRSIVEDVPLVDAARPLRSDVRNDRRTMAAMIADEKRVLARKEAPIAA